MEDIEKDEKNTIKIKIMNLTNSINTELKFIKRNEDEELELVFSNEDSETILRTGEDLIDFIKTKFNISYENMKLIYSGTYVQIIEDDNISDIISYLESKKLSGFVILKDKNKKSKKVMTLFLKTNLNDEENEIKISNNVTLLNLKEEIKKITNVEIDKQKIIFKENEINDNNKKLKDYGIKNGCTIQMEFIKVDNDDIEDIESLGFKVLKKIYDMDEKLKDPNMVDLINNPKYDVLGKSRQNFLMYNEDQIKRIMEYKDCIDNIDNIYNIYTNNT